MTNDPALAKCLTWTNSGTSFIISIANVQMFAELLGPFFHHTNVSLLFAACSLEYVFVMPRASHLDLMLILIMTVLEFRASVKYVRLQSHQSGEFVAFCFSSFINIFSVSTFI